MLPPAPGPTLALQLPPAISPRQGFQVNVLGSSLVTRLKQQRHPKEPAGKTGKPPKGAKTKPAIKKSKANTELKLEGLDDEDMHCSDDGQGGGSTVSASRRYAQTQGRQRANSANTGGEASGTGTTLPRLSSASRSPASSRLGSRRSLSAGPGQAGQSDGRRSGASASVTGFAPRAPSCPVHVVKRDGVFQPADKYMPGRIGVRDEGASTLWDYHTYVLPMMEAGNEDQSPRFSEPDLSPRMCQGSGKKRMKVSWKASAPDSQMLGECADGGLESRPETILTHSPPAPASASKQRRAQSVDNLAFRRPVYHNGRSRVSSIGLQWQIPAVSTGNIDVNTADTLGSPRMVDAPTPAQHPFSTPSTASKPMWSYLITHEARQQQQQPPLPPPPPAPSSGVSASKQESSDTKQTTRGPRHRRDVHPVSTAMERAGISVSKTRWTVPSSSASGLEAERAVRGRLQLIKRSDAKLLYEPGGRGTSNSAAQRFQQAMVAAGRADDNNGDSDQEQQGSTSFRRLKDQGRDREDTEGSLLSGVPGRARKGEGTTSGTNDDKALSPREDDQISSPTKSRSTFCN